MALQYVGGNTATKVGATSGNSTISLTTLTGGIASAAAAGDLVIAVFATGSTANRTLSITDGTTAYTLIDTELYSNGTTYDTNLRVAYKLLTANDTSVTFGPTLNAQDAGAMAVHVWRGVNTASIFDVAAVPATGTGSGRPNPASITPTTSGAFIVIAGAGSAGTGAVYTASYLSNFRTATSADTNDAMVGIGSLAWTSGPYDGAQWTGGTTNAADSWAAMTIALRPTIDKTLTPDLFTNTNNFYAISVSETDNLVASRFDNLNTFYSASLSKQYDIDANRFDNTNSFFSPTVTETVDFDLQPDLFNNQNTFYSYNVVSINRLQPSRFDNSNQIYDAEVEISAPTIRPNLFVNNNVYYIHELTGGFRELSQRTQDKNLATGGRTNLSESNRTNVAVIGRTNQVNSTRRANMSRSRR